jgi:exosortase
LSAPGATVIPSTRRRETRTGAWAQALALAALLAWAYARTFATLWSTWRTNDNYSHGPLVPLTALALVWLRREKLRALPLMPDARGLWLVGLGCLVQLAGLRADVFAAQEWSLLLVLAGLALGFAGLPALRMLAFPILYLGFMFTFPPIVIDTLNLLLKQLAVTVSAAGAKLVGATFQREGMQLWFPSGELRVEAPCSGLRSLIALLAIGALFAYFQRGGPWRRAAVLVAAVPIALAGNIARLLLLFVAADRRGVAWATGRFHDVTGYVLYAVALALLLGLRALLTPPETPERPGRKEQAR